MCLESSNERQQKMTDRRTFLKDLGLGTAALTFLGMIPPAAQSLKGAHHLVNHRKPNIVLILADDLGWHQLGSYGSTYYESPNIDRLASRGMRFTEAYAASPICSPTRASIMTGQYPTRLHITDYIPGNDLSEKLKTPDWAKSLPLDTTTIPESLKKAGYVSGHFGKWHLNVDKNYSPGRPGDPQSHGFDDVLTTHKPGAGRESKYENDAHHVREITERSLQFIEANRDKPFFCYITHNSIHRPQIEKKELIDKYAAKPDADLEEYGHDNPVQAAMLETLDKSVGEVMQKLEDLELLDNTLVIFFSDNGHLGPKDEFPLRGSKSDLYEGGIRTPLIASWPGVIEPGSVSNEIVISNDFFPTFNELVGISENYPDIDGESILPVLKQTGKLQREAVYFHYPHYHHQGIAPAGAIREGKYKLIEWFEQSKTGEDGALELFDLESDLGERHNLAADMPDLANRMFEKLKKWRKEVGAQEMTVNN